VYSVNFCKKCSKTFPLVVFISSVSSSRLLASSASKTTVITASPATSNKYTCLTYDLATGNPTSFSTVESTSSSSSVRTCTTTANNVQLYLDSTCTYINASLCQSSDEDDSDPLSPGAIAGIVIGSVVFTLIISVGIYYLLKKRRLQQAAGQQPIEQNTEFYISQEISKNQIIEPLWFFNKTCFFLSTCRDNYLEH